jgi:hypothetical protein
MDRPVLRYFHLHLHPDCSGWSHHHWTGDHHRGAQPMVRLRDSRVPPAS